DLHPFLQSTLPPAADVDPGPDFAGFVIDPPLAGAAPAPARADAAVAPGAEPEPGSPPARAGGARGRFRALFLRGPAAGLAPAGVAPRVYNLAAPWHTSLHSLYKFWTYADAVRPQLVIVLDNVNDFYRGFTPPAFSLPVYRPDYSHYAGALNPFWRAGAS